MSRYHTKDGRPAYTQEITGPIARWDERDGMFARSDLFEWFGEDSPAFRDYYTRHPENLAYDRRHGNTNAALGRTGGVDEPMAGAQFALLHRISSDHHVDGEPAAERREIAPDRAAAKVKALARLLGADLAGIGPLRQEWVYSHAGRSFGDAEGYQPWGTPIHLNHPHAIALAFKMDYALIQHAPDFPALLATAEGYATGAWVSVQLAQYIRMLGYSARAHHFHNYQVLCVPVAVDCGLGELSRAGFLLTKEYGLAVRLAVVTTDLPLAHDRPIDLGVQSYCSVCKVCAQNCPVGAIPMGGKSEHNGTLRWKLDERKCYSYWRAAGTDCGVCVASCPWTKPRTWFHRLMASLATIKGPHQWLMTQADRLIYRHRRGRPRPEYMDPRPSRRPPAASPPEID